MRSSNQNQKAQEINSVNPVCIPHHQSRTQNLIPNLDFFEPAMNSEEEIEFRTRGEIRTSDQSAQFRTQIKTPEEKKTELEVRTSEPEYQNQSFGRKVPNLEHF